MGTPSSSSIVRTSGPDSSGVGLGHGDEREVGEAEQAPVVVHGARLVAQVELFADLLLEPLQQLQHLGEREVAGLAGARSPAAGRRGRGRWRRRARCRAAGP